jgi:hypothetical protein
MATINITQTVTSGVEKEKRKCSVCNKEGHNKRSCNMAPVAPPSQSPISTQSTPPSMRTGGVIALPAEVAWTPGTDSIAFHAQMRAHPFYTYNATRNVYVRK